MSNPIPILIISDSPSCSSGLGRITRDLALRIHAHLPEFRVACAGYGGPGKRTFPFPEYHFDTLTGWVIPQLPEIVADFAGDEECIVLTIWDASRLMWFAHPQYCPYAPLREWLQTASIRKWTYTPVDAEGPFGKLSHKLAFTLTGFERVLNYTAWSAGVTGYPDHLPHGIDTSVFKPHDRVEAKKHFMASGFKGLKTDSFLVGIVATNQARKDWALGIQTCRELLDRGLDVRVWAHTDAVERFWDIPALITDYGLQGRVVLTTSKFDDEKMSWMYSACDVTLGIGLGEGFGYPLFESLASGTPVVHGDYGGAAEFLTPWAKVQTETIESDGDDDHEVWRYEGPYCNKRPVFDPEWWASKALFAGERSSSTNEAMYHLPEELDWQNLWPAWAEWLRKGLK